MNRATIRVTCPAGQIEGLSSERGRQFRGIPYAELPLGESRFRSPVRRDKFKETFPADTWGASPQRVPLFTATFIPEPSIPGDDILNLNIFAPLDAAPGDDRPVLVWIHGGGFRGGSPSGEWYRGNAITASGAIMVVPSYRLAFDGFGWLDSEHDNRGIRDLVLALEWVKENIRAFGGNPDRVTIAGQSAGGGGVLALLASPRTSGLFNQAWSMSGVLSTKTVGEADAFTNRFATLLGVERTAAGFATLTDTQLQSALGTPEPGDNRHLGVGPVPGTLDVMPVVGTTMLPEDILAGIRDVGGHIPLVLGATAEEFVEANPTAPLDERSWTELAASWGPVGERYSLTVSPGSRTPGRIATDALFRSSVAAVAAARQGGDASTWIYDVPWRPPAIGRAAHCIDVPLFLGEAESPIGIERLGSSQPLATTMHAEFLAFLHDADPGWAPISPQRHTTRVYDQTVAEVDDVFRPLEEFGALWSRLG